MSTELIAALRLADPHVHPALEAFDRIVASRQPLPDSYEQSLRLGGPSPPHRYTFYFDVHRHGAGVAREAGVRFVQLASELGLATPPALSRFVQSGARAGAEVLQVVLGIEVSFDGASVRGKYYLVFRDNPGSSVTELLGALDLVPTPGADPERVYIVGVDLTDAGVDDVKLYFRLEVGQAPKVIENAGDVADLLAASRDVVFQQCTRRPDRRQLYLHIRSTAVLSQWMAQRGFDAALRRARAINDHLQGSRIDPWIVSFPYVGRRLAVDAGTVYFHLARRGEG